MPEPTSSIRDRVAELIRSADRPQNALSRESGVGQSTISSILSGERSDLRAEVVARLARACGLSPTALGRLLYESIPAPEKSSEKIPDRD